MKICPRCQKTYADDNLNFCLEDGSVLTQAQSQSTPPQTVQMSEPRATQQPAAAAPGTQPAWNTAPQPYSMQQKKPSKTWLWVLLIIGAVVLLCGGGFIGLVAYIGSQANQIASNIASNVNSGRTSNTSSRTVSNSSTNSNANKAITANADDRDDTEKLDLQMFVKEFSVYGTTELKDDVLTMGSRQKGFYYVLVAPEEYQTAGANTRVTLQNIDNATGSLGYGLIFHSNPTPLQQDYAFLIDTKKKKYRVVHHEPQKESSVVTWTTSPAINEGSAENTLEVRDLSDKIELYINGTMVTSIRNIYGYPNGVVGLYAGDGVKVAFKDLEISK